MKIYWSLFVFISQVALSSLARADFQSGNITYFGLDNKKVVALTFDDGPQFGTERILNILKRYGIHATFFAQGNRLREYPELAKRIVAEGHVLGNHTFDHKVLSLPYFRANPTALIAEIRDTHREIQKYIKPGSKLFFRAPTGGWNAENAAILNQDDELRHYVGPICWDVGRKIEWNLHDEFSNAADWQCFESKVIPLSVPVCGAGYLFKIRDLGGGVVLMHDRLAQTADLVEWLIPKLIEEDYKFVTLAELEELDRYGYKRGANVSQKAVPDSPNSPYHGRCGVNHRQPGTWPHPPKER